MRLKGPVRTSPLKFVFLGLIVLVSCVGVAAELPLPDPKVFMYGQTPDAQVKNWIRLVVLGARDKPFPVIFFSPQRFKTPGFPEVHIVFPDREYRRLAAFTRTKRCSIRIIERPAWGTLLITEYTDAHASDLCVMPPETACDYLFSISMLSGIHWPAAKLEPIHELAASIKCRDADGMIDQPYKGPNLH